jgi:flagellar protein FliO/FliZ
MSLNLSHSLSPVAAAEAAEGSSTDMPVDAKSGVALDASGRHETTAHTATPLTPAYSGSTAGSLASMAGSLVLVLALIFAFAWLMRWMQGARQSRGTGLRVEGGVQVGAKERVVVLQAGDTRLLLGVTAQQVSLLHRFAEGASIETEPLQPMESAVGAMTPSFQQAFGEQLNKLLGRK